MNDNSTDIRFRFVFACTLAFGAAALGSPAPAGAQPYPWIGLTAHGAQLHLEVGTGHHGPGPADFFGSAVAVGDFNHDGFDDLATGIPGNDCDFVVWDCGSVQVRFGGQTGPLGASVTLDPAAAGAPELASAFDEYGGALAVGDFNADDFDDLVVGIPGDFDSPGGNPKAGGIQIHYGLPGAEGSIQWVAEHFLNQDSAGVPGEVEAVEFFGHALATGDFDGDGHDDLAIGAPKDLVLSSPPEHVGGVVVAHGHIGGLVPFGGFEMRLGLQGLPDVPEAGEDFGWALTAGDFDGDGFDDLAIGVPSEDDVGAVLVVYGSPFSLIFPDHWYFGQIDLGDIPEPGDRFGAALAAGDFNGDGFDDLAIGAPHEDGGSGSPADMGEVSVVYGGAVGLSAAGATHLWEDQLYGAGNSQENDRFGFALAAGDFDGDGLDDLAIGHDGEGGQNHGAVSVVRGRPGGLAQAEVRRLQPGPPATGMIPDATGGFPHYGRTLATGDFDGSGFADLAIGAPFRDQDSSTVDTGAVAVLYGQLFRDDFETGSLDAWSAAVP